MTLDKGHITTFLDSLRNVCNNKIKFYLVGEYGDRYKRPHYHAIILNMDYKEDRDINWNCWKASKKIEEVWRKGNVDVRLVESPDAIAYVLKYTDKENKAGVFERDDRLREFSRMSRNIGLRWLTDEQKKYLRANIGTNIVNSAGYKIALPRYYRKHLFTEKENEEYGKKMRQLVRERQPEINRKKSLKIKNYDELDYFHETRQTRARENKKRNKLREPIKVSYEKSE